MLYLLGHIISITYRQALALQGPAHDTYGVASNNRHGHSSPWTGAGLERDFSQQLSKRDNLNGRINTNILLTAEQSSAIRIVTVVLAGISLLATIIALYWFSQMRRLFRHNLIMGLIVGDLSRSLWLTIFGIVDLSMRHRTTTHSIFCQASGFFVQLGIEEADFAVLAIAIHTALQVFRPAISRLASHVQETGLFRYRYAVYLVFLVVPPFMCSLAFVRGREGYIAQGAFCTLPIRPFWYRLAISWIPRYVIMTIIAGLYLAIYIHVALQFRSISWLRHIHRSTPHDASSLTMPNTFCDGMDDAEFLRRYSIRRPTTADAPSFESENQSKRKRQFSENRSRKTSTGTTLVGRSSTSGTPTSRSIVDISPTDAYQHQESLEAPDDAFTKKNWEQQQQQDILSHSASHAQNPLQPRTADPSADLLNRGVMRDEMNERDTIRHQAIQTQIRRLFVYPVVYFFVWLFPFVNHCLNYTRRFSQYPVFPIVLLTFASLSAMGLLDCILFTLREKPWEHIPGSDGTFIGSFQFWRHARNRRESSTSAFALSERAPSGSEQALQRTSEPSAPVSFTEALKAEQVPPNRQALPNFDRSAQEVPEARGMETWDFSYADSTRRRSDKQPEWFDRRLSMAVGRIGEE